MIKITEAHIEEILIKDQNTTAVTFSVELNDAAFDLTGKTVNFVVLDRYVDTVKYTLTTSGTSPQVTVSGQTFTVDFSTVANGNYRYHVDVTDGTNLDTIMEGPMEKITRGTYSIY